MPRLPGILQWGSSRQATASGRFTSEPFSSARSMSER